MLSHDVRISDKVAAEHGADRSMGRLRCYGGDALV